MCWSERFAGCDEQVRDGKRPTPDVCRRGCVADLVGCMGPLRAGGYSGTQSPVTLNTTSIAEDVYVFQEPDCLALRPADARGAPSRPGRAPAAAASPDRSTAPARGKPGGQRVRS